MATASTAPKKRYPPANVKAKRRSCVDCESEGVTSRRKAPHPGPRCVTHWRAKRSERKDVSWERRLITIYGITADEYYAILEAQGGKCYICQRATGLGRKRLSVDHCHKTGYIRGILCSFDNRLLGHARDLIDFFQRCIDYLRNPPAYAIIGKRVAPIEAASLTLNER